MAAFAAISPWMEERASRTSSARLAHSTACSPASAVSTPTTMIAYSFRNSRTPCQGLGLWMSMPPPSGSLAATVGRFGEDQQWRAPALSHSAWKQTPQASLEGSKRTFLFRTLLEGGLPIGGFGLRLVSALGLHQTPT